MCRPILTTAHGVCLLPFIVALNPVIDECRRSTTNVPALSQSLQIHYFPTGGCCVLATVLYRGNAEMRSRSLVRFFS